MSKNPHAVALGRKGGAATKGITSEAKKLATRANLEKARAAKLHIPLEARVTINARGHELHNEWGIVKHFDGEYYHVAPWNDDKNHMVFTRSELRVSRPR